ncbi:hypothetical protein [Pyrococcus abyssi]|uniref:Uncharacterized protein n=1 Tax=Pyrococcus abyssi (strain GE5 / Orsay) TaxID=272844 RepID=Q9UYF9_PYRAB|nr:hypothetical protein [Pyrococcus abyssi]CAB50453.1 Hypothetical protein PAB1337 [Pyrococcus abyssi GE5]CCE71003.1 TPA: hypothetical protein PAB1337 [Pyrococcus abyssi GE5]
MDVGTLILIAVVVLIGSIVSAWIVSSVISQQMKNMQALMISRSLEVETKTVEKKRKGTRGSEAKPEEVAKQEVRDVSEEDIVRKIKQIIDEKVHNVANEAKKKKERLLMLLDVARGYALGFVSEDEYNAFLMRVLSELDEFKRLWLAAYPFPEDKDRLNQMLTHVARTKLPIEVREKGKGKEGSVKLSPDEALIRITSSIKSAISILDDLIKKRGDNPAVTPLEIKLSQELEKCKKKVEDLEKRLQELEAL